MADPLTLTQPVIETPRLLLRPHRLSDFHEWRAMFLDEGTRRFLSSPLPSEEESWNRLLRYIGHWSALGYGLFGVFDRADGRFLGDVGLADFHRGLGAEFDRCPEVAWIMAAAAHGHGYATEAARAAHDWFARTHGPQRTVAIIDPDNHPSLRLAARMGYHPTGECTYRNAACVMLARPATEAMA
ncbi:MAG: GNAT family N-acetyltransferase [Komagataeibacter hansenii]|uniref:GNAT family N-acetyltransferase n=1 Tax=Novacetimonas hansenii TaxID=436 RepID=A0AAW5EUF1_NOVHA|nr:GNAT family N-acetyltransferase [Novacetimonas hansenii]MBL7238576.1 GNAT family N-acetyltransferase [Novacetimonas hansenii]MCJ8354741.1 GNAT family N-acetyltransferase [Novacetimonas hansenii]